MNITPACSQLKCVTTSTAALACRAPYLCSAKLNRAHLRTTFRLRTAAHSGQLAAVSLSWQPSTAFHSRHLTRYMTQVTVFQEAAHPEFFPEQTKDVQEPAALVMIKRMESLTVNAASLTCPVQTAYIGPDEADHQPQHPDQVPVLLLHGFDSSSLEFRRLWPVLEESFETWAVDLVGWGFSDSGAAKHRKEMKLGPKQKRDHLYAFWKEKIKRPMVVVGTSLGGAIAMDFAVEYPEAVEKLVLVDAQGFIDGLGPWRVAPRWLINLLVQVLKSTAVRGYANTLAYYNQEYATKDAMNIGRLHTYLSGWAEANVAFIQSGGYAISKRIPLVQQECLVVWGRNDKILDPKYAQQFSAALPKSKLVWIEECGHCPHLEQPQALANCISDFMQVKQAEQVPDVYPGK